MLYKRFLSVSERALVSDLPHVPPRSPRRTWLNISKRRFHASDQFVAYHAHTDRTEMMPNSVT